LQRDGVGDRFDFGFGKLGRLTDEHDRHRIEQRKIALCSDDLFGAAHDEGSYDAALCADGLAQAFHGLRFQEILVAVKR